MEELLISSAVLADIEDNHTVFAEALRKVFVSSVELRPIRPVVAGLVGCELRHSMLFDFLLKDICELSPLENRIIKFALANDYFFHRLDGEKVKEYLSGLLGERFSKIEPLFGKAANPDGLIPTSMSRTSNEYLSLRYNTPEWALRIWQHFGYGNTYKLLRRFSKPFPTCLRIKTSRIKKDDVLALDGFSATNVDNVAIYKGKLPLRKVSAFTEGNVFVTKPEITALLKENIVTEPSEILCYSGGKDTCLEEELVELYQDKVTMNIAVPSFKGKEKVNRMMKSLRQRNFVNINYFEKEDPLHMQANISQECELVLAYPESSDFDSIGESPDFFLHFDKSRLDSLIAKQADVLEGCSKYVSEFGTLIYLVSTINKKEGRAIVSEFIRKHEEFVLEKDNQCFPLKDGESALYYAVIKRKKKEAKDTVLLDTVFQSSNSISPEYQADSK